MDLITQIKSADFLIRLMRGDHRNMTPYPFVPEKKRNLPSRPAFPLERSSPEKQGISSRYLERFFRALDECGEIHVHNLILLRHGRVIAEAGWKPYTAALPQMMYSLSKSVVGMAVGLAMEDGLLSLDEKLTEIFPEKSPFLRSPRISALTVRHLLTMSTGVRFNELGTVVEKDWVRAYLQSDCAFEPGSEFSYNSLNSYMLSAAVCRRTGMSLVQYLTPRLFEPLGIRDVSWEKCPMGIEKGGWGLYLRPEDMAKLGQLYLEKGRWTVNGEEKQLIPGSWIEESCKMRKSTGMGKHQAGYGYQLWSFPVEGSFQFNGVFGQYVIVLPEQDMVLAMTSGSQSLFIDESASIIKRFFDCNGGQNLAPGPLPTDLKGERSLRAFLGGLALVRETKAPPPPRNFLLRAFENWKDRKKPEELTEEQRELDGREYSFAESQGSLMPFILQGVRNNFCGGISSLGLRFLPGCCVLSVAEGQNRNSISAGMDGRPRRGELQMNGESYAVGASARLVRDEDGRPVLKLFLSFLETPHTRLIKFIFHGETVTVKFEESPSVEGATNLLFQLVGGSDNSMGIIFADEVRKEKLIERVASVTKPKAKGTLKSAKQ